MTVPGDIADPSIPSNGTNFADLSIEIRQKIFSTLLGWTPTTPPLLFDSKTQHKLVASVKRNNARLKRNRKTPLKRSEYLHARQMWPEEQFQLSTLRALLLVSRQTTLDMHGLMGMKASELVMSNLPRTILRVDKMLDQGEKTIWPSTIVIDLFPRKNTLPGQRRLGPSKLIFAPQCGVAAADEHAAAYATLRPRGTYWPPFFAQRSTRMDLRETQPHRMLAMVHRHLERWIEAAFRLPQQVLFVRVEVDLFPERSEWAAITHNEPPGSPEFMRRFRASGKHYIQLKDIVELVRILRVGKSPTCEFGGEGAVEVERGTRKVMLMGEQPQAEIGTMDLAPPGSATPEMLEKHLKDCLRGYRNR